MLGLLVPAKAVAFGPPKIPLTAFPIQSQVVY